MHFQEELETNAAALRDMERTSKTDSMESMIEVRDVESRTTTNNAESPPQFESMVKRQRNSLSSKKYRAKR